MMPTKRLVAASSSHFKLFRIVVSPLVHHVPSIQTCQLPFVTGSSTFSLTCRVGPLAGRKVRRPPASDPNGRGPMRAPAVRDLMRQQDSFNGTIQCSGPDVLSLSPVESTPGRFMQTSCHVRPTHDCAAGARRPPDSRPDATQRIQSWPGQYATRRVTPGLLRHSDVTAGTKPADISC